MYNEYNEHNDVASFDSSDNLFSAYSPLGRNFGHPGVNTVMRLMFGQNYMPASDNGQSMHDAVLQRNRSTEFMNLQRSGLMNNGMASRVGLGSQHPLLGMLGSMASPDSALARTMSPFMGGNPMASQMQLYAGLAGSGVMGNFGRMEPISAGETENVMQKLEEQFYTRQKYAGPKGVREEINAKGKEAFRAIAATPNANEIYENLGFKGVKADKEGKLNAKGEEILKGLDIADENDPVGKRMDAQNTVKQGTASMLSAELDKVLNNEDEKTDKALREGFLKKVQSTLKLSREEYQKYITKDSAGRNNAYGSLGDLDATAAKAEIAKLTATSPLSALRAEARAAEKEGYVVKGFDFAKSRGFKLEDFTSGFVKAADLRMLGNRKGQGIAASMDDFAGASGGALSAARAVFGDKSGAELVSKISNIAGADADLGSAQGADKVEDLLRKVNATARVAGISIKTMLSIIDAGKQLASNHPALQSTSSAAITELSMRAVGTASSLGATMSASDYRKAGGGQGIASQEIKTALEFAAGPVGATIATAYYGATKEEKKQLDELLDKSGPVTGNSLDRDLRSKMAKIRGMTTADLSRLSMDNPELLAEAMKDTDTADTVYKAAKPALTAAMTEHLSRVGLSSNAMLETYKKADGDFSRVDAQVRKYLVTPQDKRVWQHSKIGIQESLDARMRSKPEKAAYEEFVKYRDQSAKDEKEMDKKYASRYSPLVTQVFDALSSGTASKDLPSALMHVFATSNKNTEAGNTALEAAQKAGEHMATIVSTKGMSDEDMIKKRGLTVSLNNFIQARKDAGVASGDTAATAGLKKLSKEELTTATEMGGSMDVKDSESAKKELTDLQALSKTPEWNDPMYEGTKKRLATLQAWEKTGIIDSTKAITTAQKGGVKAFTSATVFAAADANYKKYAEEEKTAALKSASTDFDNLQGVGGRNASDAQQLKNYYSDNSGKVDYAKMVKDFNKGEGSFDKEQWGDYWSNGKASEILGGTQEKIVKATNRANTLSATSPDLQARTDLGAIMEKLVGALGEKGSIGGGIAKLVTALNSF